MSDLVRRLQRRKTPLVMLFDAACWLTAFIVWSGLRLDWGVADWTPALIFGAVAAVLHVVLGFAVRLHHGRSRIASLDELIVLGSVISLIGLLLFFINFAGIWVPRSVPLGAALLTLFMTALGRAIWRRLKERDQELSRAEGSTPVLLVGAGDAAHDLIVSMLRDPSHQWRPVGMLDDDPYKRHRRIRGVPVLGHLPALVDVAAEHGVDTVILAIPSASAKLITDLNQIALAAGLQVKVLPGTNELLSAHVGIRDIRDINLTDVLGRHQLDTDIESIAGNLAGKRVLVTGAGGSIGAELCRQIDRFSPGELMMLDRDESALHAVQLSLRGRALLDSDDVILCDIRDLDALRTIFTDRRPQVVFHAAALKHLPMLEQFPAEAVKTNVIGTRNVLDAAREVGVERFVNISTDKAANPSSVLGYSKRIAERITANHAAYEQGTYLSVRFGNVLGSRGSVLTAFAQQIAAGGPVTVTDREVTRYFMTIVEACQLVVQAAAIGRPGEALVLDMGDPIRIIDVADQLIEQSGRPVPIEITGLRAGEKLHEELFADDEPQDVRPEHSLVSHVPVPGISDDQINGLPTSGPTVEVVRALAALCLLAPVSGGHGRR